MRADADDLTVLLVAEGERLAPALRERLLKHGLNVHDCARTAVADTAFVVAPDLVVLAGLAAADGGLDVLAVLAARPGTAGLPVVLIGDPAQIGERNSNFRHGVVAVIEHTASADELARRIAEVAHELPERTGEATGAVDAGGVQALVELLAESLRTGILSVTGPDGVTARVVLRADRPASEVIAQIVERLRPLADARSGVRYEFHESPTGKLGALDLGGDDDSAALADLPRSRLLLIEQNPARADLLAQGLRAHGARVAVADGLGRGLELARELTPDVVVVDGSAVDGWALEALRKIRRDPALRWASLLLVEASRLWRDERRPDVAMLAASIESLMRADRELVRRLLVEPEVGTRLEVLGPVRTLRALAETKIGLRIRVQHPRVIVEVDLSDGIIVGASARLPNAQSMAAEGPAALATLLALSSGRVQVERAEAPRSANIMSPVDDAIAAAAEERPVVPGSQPPPSLVPPVPRPRAEPLGPRETGDVGKLVAHLEQLLGELRTHVEPSKTHAADVAKLDPTTRQASAVTAQYAALDATTEPAHAPPAQPVAYTPALPEETTTTVTVTEIARLRRQMRDSSQRLLAAPLPPAAALSAPVVRSRKQTLLGVTVDVALPPVDTQQGPALVTPPAQAPPDPPIPRPLPPPAAKPPLRAPSSAKLPPPALPPPKSPSLTLPAPKPPPPRPSRATPPPLERDAQTAVAQVEPAVEEAARFDSAPTGLRPAAAVLAPESSQRSGPDADIESVADLASSADLGDVDFGELDAQPTNVGAPPSFFSLAGGPPPPRASFAQVPPTPPPSIPPAPERAVLPTLAQSDATPLPQLVDAPKRRSKAPLFIAIFALGLIVVGLLAFVAWKRLRAPATPIAAITVGATIDGTPTTPRPTPVGVPTPVDVQTPTDTPPPTTDTPPPTPTDTPPPTPVDAPPPTPVDTPPAVPPVPASGLGPAADAPVEGSDADFDLARLGIRPVPPPSSRRVRLQFFARLQRQANQVRRQHRLDEAETTYVQLLAMDPTNGRATAGLALIHLERAEHAEAIFWAQRLARLQSAQASHWVLLGDTLRAGGNRAAATRAYSRALVVQANYLPARARLEELTPPTR